MNCRNPKFLVAAVLIALAMASCSIPNLEPQECVDARDTVTKFYSFHFGNEMKPSPENLKLRAKYLTPELLTQLENSPTTDVDYFTATNDYPKAFSDGTCELPEPGRALFRVNLFWKDDTRSEQRELNVEAVKRGDGWLINKVTPK